MICGARAFNFSLHGSGTQLIMVQSRDFFFGEQPRRHHAYPSRRDRQRGQHWAFGCASSRLCIIIVAQFSGLGHGSFLSLSELRLKCSKLRMPTRYRWRWRCVVSRSYPVPVPPPYGEPCYRCLINGSVLQWTEPYTERLDLNSSRNVRRLICCSSPSKRLSSGVAIARPHPGWLPDRRGSHDCGLQPSCVSTTATVVRSARTPKLPTTVAAKSPLTTSPPCRHVHRKHVIHAVGPVYHPRSTRAPLQLAGCYRVSLQLAAEHGLKHIVS